MASADVLMARPCPIVPRHGFVESRIVRSGTELIAVAREALEADDKAELVLQPPIDAHWNAIVTRTGITLGRGNDGATAGKSAVYLPIPSTLSDIYGDTDIAKHPYIELVGGVDQAHGDLITYIVQLRDGPEVQPVTDYIPNDVTVTEVYTVNPNGDLLQFERDVASLPDGAVVYHEGGAIHSHWGVHCVLNKIPYITSHEPHIGERLKATNSNYEWTQRNYRELAWVGRAAAKTNADTDMEVMYHTDMLAAFAVIHAAGHLLTQRPHHATYSAIAWSIMTILRGAAASSLGEVRFAGKQLRLIEVDPRISIVEQLKSKPSRQWVYARALNFNLEQILVALHTSEWIFDNIRWADGYGGEAWRHSTENALFMARAWYDFVRSGNADKLHATIQYANNVLNSEHNGGKYLNKIMNVAMLDHIAANPGLYFLRSHTAVNHILGGGYRPYKYRYSITDPITPRDTYEDWLRQITAGKKHAHGLIDVYDRRAYVDIPEAKVVLSGYSNVMQFIEHDLEEVVIVGQLGVGNEVLVVFDDGQEATATVDEILPP